MERQLTACPQGHQTTGQHCLECSNVDFTNCSVQNQLTDFQLQRRAAELEKRHVSLLSSNLAGIKNGRLTHLFFALDKLFLNP